jgi:hypothetical protein
MYCTCISLPFPKTFSRGSNVFSVIWQLILSVLSAHGKNDRSLFAIVSDHGRKSPFGRYHGALTDLEMNTFWLVR